MNIKLYLQKDILLYSYKILIFKSINELKPRR